MSTSGAGMWIDVDRSPVARNGFALEFGSTKPLWVRAERVERMGLCRPVMLLYASDLHLGGRWSRRVVSEVVAAARMATPDLIVLGGDLADSRRGLHDLETCVARLAAVGPVWGVAGNHDRVLGIASVRRAFEAAGGRWLQDRCEEWVVACAGTVWLDGKVEADDSWTCARILCAHDPAIFPEATRAGYRLVLAGHLHGSQCVLAERNGMLYPGAWFFRWNGLRFSAAGCTMLVSRGAADTLPVRWNCPREVLLCELA